jgi:hypothetical protein
MAFAKTLTTPTGGGFVFQPAEPRRRFRNRFICIGWLVYSGRSDRCENNTTLGGVDTSSATSTPDHISVWRVLGDDEASRARVGMKRLFRSGR